MALDVQSIIAIIALLVTCPPTCWLLYKLYTRYRYRRQQEDGKQNTLELKLNKVDGT